MTEDNVLELPEEPMNVECEAESPSDEVLIKPSLSNDDMEPVVEVVVPSTAGSIKIEATLPVSASPDIVVSTSMGTVASPPPVAVNTSTIPLAPSPIRLKSYSGPSAKPVAIGSVRNIKPVNTVSISNNSGAPKSVSY